MCPEMTTASKSAAQQPPPPPPSTFEVAKATTPAPHAQDARDIFVPLTPATPKTSTTAAPKLLLHQAPVSTPASFRRPVAVLAGSICTGVIGRAGWHLTVHTLPAVLGPYALGVLPFVAIDAGLTLYRALTPGKSISQDAISPRHAAVVGAMLCAAMSGTLASLGYVAPAVAAPVALAAVVIGLCLGAAVCLVLQQATELRRITHCLDSERQTRAQHEAAAATTASSPAPASASASASDPTATTASPNVALKPHAVSLPQTRPARSVTSGQTHQRPLSNLIATAPSVSIATPTAFSAASVLTRESLRAWCLAPGMLLHEKAVRQNIAERILAAAAEGESTVAPRGLIVKGDLDLSALARLSALPTGLTVHGALRLSGCRNLKHLPENLYVKDDLDVASCSALTKMPNTFTIGGALDVSECISLTAIPKSPSQRIHGPVTIARATNTSALPFDLHTWRAGGQELTPTRGGMLLKRILVANQSIGHAALHIGG